MGSDFKSKRKTGANKNLPYLSHEFVIQNHADIVTCLLMVFVAGLMFQVSTPLAQVFISPQYNLTESSAATALVPTLYSYGLKDVALVFFYSLAAIVFHAVLQEYVLDKLSRKVRQSKTKLAKFNESGQLLAFYLVSVAWAAVIFRDEQYFQSTLSFFWSNYPQAGVTAWTKMFFIVQMSYWLHQLPELYFQKVKREEYASKVTSAVSNFLIVAAVYLLNFSRVGLVLLTVHNLVEFLFHLSRFIHLNGKSVVSKLSFQTYNIVAISGRLASCAFAAYVFLVGLAERSVNLINLETSNFNTQLTRYTCLFVVLSLELAQLFSFVSYKFKNSKENSKVVASSSGLNTRSRTKKAASASSPETSDIDSAQTGGDETPNTSRAAVNRLKAQ